MPNRTLVFTEADRDNIADRLDNVHGGITLAHDALLQNAGDDDSLIAARRTLELVREELKRVHVLLDKPFERPKLSEVSNG